jgi:accessory gene regulator B
MIEAVSSKIAIQLKNTNPNHPASLDVLKYSIAMIINIMGTIILSLSMALLLGHFLDTVLAMASFAILRMVSGGYHLNSSAACMFITSFAANLIPYINLSSAQPIWILTLISMLLAILFAPSNIEQSSRIPKRYYPFLKYVSIVLIASNFIIQSDVMAISFLLQTLLLIDKRR